MSKWVKRRRKAIAAAAGVALALVATYVAPDSTVGRVIAVLLAAGRVAGVWAVPNEPQVPASVQYLRDQAAARTSAAGKHTAAGQ